MTDLSLSMRLSLSAADPPRQLYRVKHLFELSDFNPDPNFAGVPEVTMLHPGETTPMTREWQEYCLVINGMARTDRSAAAQKVARVILSDDRFLCDAKGGHDYISGENANAADPRAKSLTCRGNVVSGVEGTLANGIAVLFVDVLDNTRPPDFSITRERFPWLVPEATNIVFSTLRVNPFDTLGGRNTGRGLRFPMLGDPALHPYIHMLDLERLPLGAPVPSPYVPPM